MSAKNVVGKPTILMVHGAFGGGWAFDKFQSHFETFGYSCIAPDLRHHDQEPGQLPSPELARTSLRDYLHDLEALIDTLEGEVVLMGHSMGGLLCQMLAARGHGTRLVLLAPSPPAGIIPATSMEMLTAFGTFASGMGWGQNSLAPDRKTAADHALPHMSGRPKKAILDRLMPESGYALYEIMCWMLDPHQASRVDARKVVCPVLAIAGSHDSINAPDTVRQVARRYGDRADFHCVENVGHWVLDGPKWQEIAQHCVDWLEQTRNEEQSDATAGATSGR
ncbi:MAG: alpha/beta hydrolase [Alphaproteobacteria bacterium]